jgi:flavin reductase (DIM6/NTAB) family NADH-FMN oxidoreductase RutF
VSYTTRPAPAPVTGEGFRQALSWLSAGVSIVTTIGSEGQKLGFTATSVTSVSLNPPLVLVCVGNWSRAIDPIIAQTPFIIHFLAADQEHLARQFASSTPDKFSGVAYQLTASGCPRIEEAHASVESTPHQIYPAGDHTIIVGLVVDIQCGDPRSPLLYFRRQFHTL